MISGNCNRSPQYAAMGPGANQHPFAQQQHHHQQPPQLLFMAGGNVTRFPQMSRGFSMMPNGGPLRPTAVQCDMQQGFGGGYGYTANSAPIFQQHHHYNQQSQHHQPRVICQQPPQQHFIQQPFISPPQVMSTAPTSGFINGIKNMVKGFIHPLNCDFYSDHHKYYNPKYRNNYMRDIAAEKISFASPQPEPRVQTVMIGLEMAMPTTNMPHKKSATVKNVPKHTEAAVPRNSPPKTTEVVAIFTSEDFPELPAPRRSRSITPAKTEKTPSEQQQQHHQVLEEQKETEKLSPPREEVSAPSMEPKLKSTFFEIKYSTQPCGRRPTFGGRMKVVPPPFTLHKSPQTCRTRCTESNTTTHEDCDTEEDSFVIFPNERPDNFLFSSFGACRQPRQRQISECSDDSFVVFCAEDVDGLALDANTDDDEDDDEDEDDDVDSDEETSSEEEDDEDDADSDTESEDEIDNGTDVVDSSFLGRNKTDRNMCAGARLLDPVMDCAGAHDVEFDSGFDEKKVTFNLHPVVHVMHAWNFAYRAARKGHWEDVARDRTRFQKRIERTSVYLNPILTPEHREKIYRSRFCDDTDNQSQIQEQHQTNTRSLQAPVERSDDNQRLPKWTKTLECAKF